jgi:hypothetical protein
MANVNTELQRSSTTTVSLNDTIVRTLFGVPSGQISMSNGYGKAYTIPGNSGILTSGSSFTLPTTSGLTINVLVIGAGGGGGGGSGRTFASGYYTGGGAGGAGGNAYALNVPVTPGQSVTFSIGGGGAGGNFRDGVFSGGSNGSAGNGTTASVNGTVWAWATGGGGGVVSPTGTGGFAGSVFSTGTQAITPTAGADAGSGTTIGGLGAKGYTINTTVGLSIGSIIGYGSTGTAGGENSGQYGVSGTVYGAGGTGGGCSQSDVYNYNNIFSTAGTAGAVFIWWGY